MAFPSIANLSRPRLTQTFYGFGAVRTSNSIPLVVVAPPHPDQLLLPMDLILEFVNGDVAYSGALAYTLAYSGGGTTVSTMASIAGNANMIQYVDAAADLAAAAIDLTSDLGKGFTLTCGADRTLGTGIVIATLIYRIKKFGG